MPLNLTTLLLASAFAWLLFITILLWRVLIHYNRMSEGAGGKGLRPLLEEIVKDNATNKKDIEMLRNFCDKIEKEGEFHIQKLGLIRFNPFKDTGGDQSFILTLTDKNDTGVIISGLYSRSGVRWYAKKIKNGKGVEHDLSEDEKKALAETKSINKS